MNHIRRICRSLFGLPRRAGLLLASAAAPAVLWADPPLPPGWSKYLYLPAGLQPAVRFPPGWNKHPPLPAHAHTVVIGGLPGWQLTLAVVLLVAVVVAMTYPGLGRTAAGALTYRPTGGRLRSHGGPQGQPAALARPAPPRHNHRAGARP